MPGAHRTSAVPEAAIHAVARQLEPPTSSEGFAQVIRIDEAPPSSSDRCMPVTTVDDASASL